MRPKSNFKNSIRVLVPLNNTKPAKTYSFTEKKRIPFPGKYTLGRLKELAVQVKLGMIPGMSLIDSALHWDTDPEAEDLWLDFHEDPEDVPTTIRERLANWLWQIENDCILEREEEEDDPEEEWVPW